MANAQLGSIYARCIIPRHRSTNMPHSRVYGALSFFAFLRDASGFVVPALRAGGHLLSQSRGIRKAGGGGGVGRATFSSGVGVVCSRNHVSTSSRTGRGALKVTIPYYL